MARAWIVCLWALAAASEPSDESVLIQTSWTKSDNTKMLNCNSEFGEQECRLSPDECFCVTVRDCSDSPSYADNRGVFEYNTEGHPSLSEHKSVIFQLENKPEWSNSDSRCTVIDSEPNMFISQSEINDRAVPDSWGLDRVDQRGSGGDGVYSHGEGGYGIRIYMLDTGLQYDHKEFQGRAIPAAEWSPNTGLKECSRSDTSCAADENGHGTRVAGVAGGKTYGVASHASLHAVKVLNTMGLGSTFGLAATIHWASQDAVKANVPSVISASLGGAGRSQAVKYAIEEAVQSNVLVVVAAGNEADDACSYTPAYVTAAITVGATANTDMKSTFSNYGKCLDMFAPGEHIRTAAMDSISANLTEIKSGTSMSAPMVAGTIALLRQKQAHLGAKEIRELLECDATKDAVLHPGDNSVNRLLFTGASRSCGVVEADAASNAQPVAASQAQQAKQQAERKPLMAHLVKGMFSRMLPQNDA